MDAVAALYATGAGFRSHPFRDRDDPARFAGSAFAEEEPGPEVWFAEPTVVGEGRAAVEWWAMARSRDGGEVTIAGVSLLRFDEEGLVVDERDYWAETASRREPYSGWAD